MSKVWLPRLTQKDVEDIRAGHALLEPCITALQSTNWAAAGVVLRNVAIVDMLLCRLFNKTEAAILRQSGARPTEGGQDATTEQSAGTDEGAAEISPPVKEGS